MQHTLDSGYRRLFIIGGACGIISVLLYLIAVSLSLPDSPSQAQISFAFLLGTGWPVVGMIYSYALYRLIALEGQGLANRFAFLLSIIGLATVTAMISVQLAVQFGIHEYRQLMGEPSQADWDSILSVVAAYRFGPRPRLGCVHGLVHDHYGASDVRAFSAGSTMGDSFVYPWLSACRLERSNISVASCIPGLFDVGPAVGLYMLLLSALLLVYGLTGTLVSSKRGSRASPDHTCKLVSSRESAMCAERTTFETERLTLRPPVLSFDQHAYRVRFEWGERGIEALGPTSDIIVIVDVLSFTTSVDIAVSRGAPVFPFRHRDASAAQYASQKRSILAASRNAGGYTRSPASLLSVPAGCRIVLPSPNGSTLSLQAARYGVTIAGCLRNAPAFGEYVRNRGGTVAVIACGERWADGTLRPAWEDIVGAGR